jgi:hypothetical protein
MRMLNSDIKVILLLNFLGLFTYNKYNLDHNFVRPEKHRGITAFLSELLKLPFTHSFIQGFRIMFRSHIKSFLNFFETLLNIFQLLISNPILKVTTGHNVLLLSSFNFGRISYLGYIECM